MINRRLILTLALVAMTGVASAAYATAQTGSASQFIHRLGNQAITTLRAPGITLEEREARFRGILRQGFDVPFIGRFVLGRYWKQITPEVRADYLSLFSEYVVQIYSARLGGYSGETLSVVAERSAGTKDVVVSTRIVRPSGPPITAEWRVRVSDSRMRIIDVSVEGVSMVVTQRSEFASVIQRNGVEGLIEVLRARTTKMSVTAAIN
jgi:phospholipid transport system substrate-binding protein